MVTSIARQSVMIKCNMQKSILTGNYEFYYAAGLAAKLADIEIDDDRKPEELKILLYDKLSGCVARDEREAYLFQLLMDYRPSEEYDEQMKELFLWGKEEKELWSATST